MDNHKPIQMRLLESTIEKVASLQKALETSSRTDAVVRCIDIAKEVVDAIYLEGKTVQFVDENGNVERLVIPGLRPRNG